MVVELMMPTKLPVIVCVDDDEAMLSTVVRCLKREQFEDPLDAVGQARRSAGSRPDDIAVLVSDYDMPEMTGAQLAGHAGAVRRDHADLADRPSARSRPRSTGSTRARSSASSTSRSTYEQLRAAVHAGSRHKELVAMSGERQRRERRSALHTALEAEYPGISNVTRTPGQIHDVSEDRGPRACWASSASLRALGDPVTAAGVRDGVLPHVDATGAPCARTRRPARPT